MAVLTAWGIGFIASVVLAFMALVVGLIALCFSLYLHFVVHQKYRHIPGPSRSSFFLGNLPDLTRYAKEGRILSDAIIDWTVEYGPVLVIYIFHRAIITANSPAAVKEFVVSTKHPKGKKLYTDFGMPFGYRLMGRSLLTEIDHDSWARKRAVCDPAFHRKALRKYMDQFNACGDLLVEKLSNMADGKTEVRLLDELNRITVDAIAKVAFGLELNSLNEKDASFNQAIMTVFNGLQYDSRNPWDRYNPSFFMRKKRKEVADACHLLRETGRECVRNRLKAKSRGEPLRDDVLTLMVEGSEVFEDLDGKIDMDHIVDNFVTLFIAGQETTANTLAFTFLEICRNEEVMHRLRTEIEAVVADKDVQFEDLTKLSYTTTVFKETLRMYPPAIGTSRDIACDTTLHGVTIPEGSNVIISTYVTSRMEEYFKEPLVYDPDRFRREQEIIPHSYFPFMVGPRSCIGQQFAMIETKVLISKLLKNFHFELVPDQSFQILQEITLKPKDGCKVFLTLRDN